MSIGFFQLIIILLFALILFGKFPTILSDISKGLYSIKNYLTSNSDTLKKLDNKNISSTRKKIDDKS